VTYVAVLYVRWAQDARGKLHGGMAMSDDEYTPSTTYLDRRNQLREASTYAGDLPSCDVVMKGGITSGVVYPMAVCELAAHYNFRRIGGTSAGAIAAAGTAAAEYGRQAGTSEHFAILARLPDQIADNGMIEKFFQPQAGTRSLYRTMLAATGERSGPLVVHIGKVLMAAMLNFKVAALMGAIPALILAVLILHTGEPRFGPAILGQAAMGIGVVAIFVAIIAQLARQKTIAIGAAVVFAVATAAAILLWKPTGWTDDGNRIATAIVVAVAAGSFGKVAATLTRIVSAARFDVAKNNFGMCSGSGDADALTPWLYNFLNKAAGLPAGGDPLTFGQLWTLAPDASQLPASTERKIDLRAITTNLTLGQPHEFPYFGVQYWFSKREFEALFPAPVVAWMIAHGATVSAGDAALAQASAPAGDSLHPMPDAQDIPVVVATRMSLSFPVLLSAVPLWRIARAYPQGTQPGAPPIPDPACTEPIAPVAWGEKMFRCWFSDGGISSNFPVHLFDAPVPGSPTFALNLRGFHAAYAKSGCESKNVYLPLGTSSGQQPWFSLFGTEAPLESFVGRILSVSRSWRDNSRIYLPAYRRRIAHVSLGEDEGGLNIKMPPDTLRRLAERGWWAGNALAQTYAATGGAPSQAWVDQRWARFLTTAEALQNYLQAFEKGWSNPSLAPSYAALVAGGATQTYDVPATFRTAAAHLSNELSTLITSAAARPYLSGAAQSPNPELELTLGPGM